MWTSVSPTGGGSVGDFCTEVSGAAASELFGVAAVALAGDDSAGPVEVETFSTTGVDEAAEGVDEATVSPGGVAGAVESVDVAATCASTGLTTANPNASAMTSTPAPANMMLLLVFILIIIT